ncbi:MAG: hypothetical protein GXP04_05395 [Alphaproteobacteria bacterium]|nr:hypothetical protein [Alphaproteobacteria bacterium]
MGSASIFVEYHETYGSVIGGAGQLELQHIVLKLAFLERSVYSRKEGFRTLETALPFKALREICKCESLLAGIDRELLNQIQDELERWNKHLSE